MVSDLNLSQMVRDRLFLENLLNIIHPCLSIKLLHVPKLPLTFGATFLRSYLCISGLSLQVQDIR